ncbi:MAG: hypothetical protein IPP13_07945 [Kouleothrix sp.]|nr:hypothetical protein [Kouleothrix sp.]
MPSILVLARPTKVPSASRTLGAAPFAYILVASGIWWLVRGIPAVGRLRTGSVVGALLLAVIFGLNMERYFGDYIGGLPYHGVSINTEIAAYVDRLPDQTQVYLAGCC